MNAASVPRRKGFDMNVQMRDGVRRLQRDENGLTTVEYVIVLCLIAGLAVGTWQKFGKSVEGHLIETKDSIDAAMTAE
jgi:Flp pilus assembly pilin Flp